MPLGFTFRLIQRRFQLVCTGAHREHPAGFVPVLQDTGEVFGARIPARGRTVFGRGAEEERGAINPRRV